jgi:hypothetical protein
MTETRDLSELRPHPENSVIFGDPEESEQFDAIKSSIRQFGIWEPLAVKADGTILSGHLRFTVAKQLKLKSVPVRVVDAFASYRDEVSFVIRSNTDRRQLTKGEIGIAFKRLKDLPKEEGGTKKKPGPKGNGGAKPTNSKKGRDDAAAMLGVGTDEARALETVFTTPGVPDELKSAVNSGKLAPTPAAKAVRTEKKRQGGEITDASALKAVAEKPVAPKASPAPEAHADRVAAQVVAFDADYRVLFELYQKLDGVLTRRPLKSVIGPTEHHRWRDMIRDVSLRAWREIESVDGPTNVGRQMSLTVVSGGKSS